MKKWLIIVLSVLLVSGGIAVGIFAGFWYRSTGLVACDKGIKQMVKRTEKSYSPSF